MTSTPNTLDEAAAASRDYEMLQREYGGRYVAWRGDRVIASAESYDTLSDALRHDRHAGDTGEVTIEYVEPPDLASAY